MGWVKTIRTFAVVAVLTFLALIPTCSAQDLQGWHLRSTMGFDFSGNTFTPTVGPETQPSSPSSTIGGELGMDLSGIVMDPKFVTFDTNFNFMHGANSINQAGYSNGVIGGGANVEILPSSRYPLSIFYQRTGANTSDDLFGSNSDISQFRAAWTLDLPHMPHLVLAYNDNSNDVKLVTSISNTSYKNSDFSLQANDKAAGFFWNAGFDLGRFDETSLGSLAFSNGVTEDYRTFQGRAFRSFWGGKAVLSNSVYDQHYDFDFLGQGTSLNDTLLFSSNLQVQHTTKLASHYTFSFSRLNETNTLADNPSGVSILNPPTLNTESAGAEISYQVSQPIRVFQGILYEQLTPFSSTLESETSFLESYSGVSAIKRWRGLDLSATYTGYLNTLQTSFANSGKTWSNNIDADAGWGNVRKVHLRGSYRYDRLNLVQEIGGFSQVNTYGGQAETTRFWNVRLSGGVDHGKIDILNISGETKRDYNNYMVQIEHRRFHLTASRGLNDGSGSIFPNPLLGSFFISVPLPVSQLIATPLLNITSKTTNFNATLRPRNNLEVGAYFRKEDDLLLTSTQNYRLWEIRARYNIGRISVDGGFGNIQSSIVESNIPSGLGINRYWFRILRTFNFF